MKRRDLVQLAAATLAGFAPRLLAAAEGEGAASSKPAIRRARKRFREVAASLYPWDLLDEGAEPILDTLAETTGTNSVYLVALMHQEKRPLTDFYYPHNPKRKTYFPEDSRVYWHPHAEQYAGSKIKPRGSDRAELKGTDWLRVLVTAGRKRRWKTGAEISPPTPPTASSSIRSSCARSTWPTSSASAPRCVKPAAKHEWITTC